MTINKTIESLLEDYFEKNNQTTKAIGEFQSTLNSASETVQEFNNVLAAPNFSLGGLKLNRGYQNPFNRPEIKTDLFDNVKTSFKFPAQTLINTLTGVDTYIKKQFNQEKTFLSKPLSYINETKTTINDTVEFIGNTSKGITDVLDSFNALGTNKFTKTTSWLSKSLTKATPYLQSIGAGGMTGYTLGKQNALLGIGGGMAIVFL